MEQGNIVWDKPLRRDDRLCAERLDDELVMLDEIRGKYLNLNPVAARIWELLETPTSPGELCAVLMAEFDVTERVCRSHTLEFLEDLSWRGMLHDA